jgi:restriction endonuclease S subunit
MALVNDDIFTINDNANVIFVKEKWRDKINLKWFIYQYQEMIFNLLSSKSDNATFNKTYLQAQKIIVPDIKIQNEIAAKINQIDEIKTELKTFGKEVK